VRWSSFFPSTCSGDAYSGVPITDFCDQNRLTPRTRLELFVSVCKSVQHAHQKGIIHRDIKPGNIIVSPDGKPHLTDFGLARHAETKK